MGLETHSDHKYSASQLLSGTADWDTLRIEHRHVAEGAHNPVTSNCTELVIILAGQAVVRRTGDGERQERLATPGTSWLVPAGTHETQLELDGSLTCIHLFVPRTLLDHSALADYGIDPARTQLVYAGGVSDAVLTNVGGALHGFLRRGAQPTDRLFVDGIRTSLAAHLLGGYSVDRWPLSAKTPALHEQRFKRVLDFIEAQLSREISLERLAAEACLSPYHFSRSFRASTGMSPHRYVTHRRIQAAQKMLLSTACPLVQIAIDTGFGCQANFTRVFRKMTGMAPGQYRSLARR
jgi:AraC family transcriptional regulator